MLCIWLSAPNVVSVVFISTKHFIFYLMSMIFLDFAIDSKIRCLEISYCPHGDLHHQINCGGHYTNTDVAKWITQILSALMHVHEHCVLRRDIKPANILLGNGMTAMLADFGIAILEDQAPYAERCGTPGYEAPDIVATKQYGTLADIWSFSRVVFALVKIQTSILKMIYERSGEESPDRRHSPAELTHLMNSSSSSSDEVEIEDETEIEPSLSGHHAIRIHAF